MKSIIKKVLLLMSMLLVFAGCSASQSKESQLCGEWYAEGSSHAAFIIYNDGTCEIYGEYGTGTWSLVNDNQLKLTNYYGESETATIDQLDNNKLVLSAGGSSRVFVKKTNSKPEETSGNGESSDDNQKNQEFSFDGYKIESILKKQSDSFTNEESFTIDSDGYFWVVASDTDSHEERMLCIDYEGNLKLNIPIVTEYPYFLTIVDDKYLVQLHGTKNRQSIIFDLEGNNIANNYCEGNEELVNVFGDSKDLTIWTLETKDTYDAHDLIVRLKTLDGTVKAEWSESELKKKNEEAELSDVIKHLGGPWYKSGNMVFNIDTNVEICCAQGSIQADENCLLVVFTDHSLGQGDILVYDSKGNDVTSSFNPYLDRSYRVDYYGDGVIYFDEVYGDHGYYLDINGNVLFDVDGFKSKNSISGEYILTSFKDGKAVANIANEADVVFTTVINKKGEILFEPVAGGYGNHNLDMWKFKYVFSRSEDGKSVYYLMDDSGNVIKMDGVVYLKEGDELKSYITIEDGELKKYPVEIIETGSPVKQSSGSDNSNNNSNDNTGKQGEEGSAGEQTPAPQTVTPNLDSAASSYYEIYRSYLSFINAGGDTSKLVRVDAEQSSRFAQNYGKVNAGDTFENQVFDFDMTQSKITDKGNGVYEADCYVHVVNRDTEISTGKVSSNDVTIHSILRYDPADSSWHLTYQKGYSYNYSGHTMKHLAS